GVKVVSYPENRGKGYALTYGFSCSTGNVITFIDVDCDLPPEQLKNFFPYLATADMVIGSKRHPFSLLEYPLIRRFLSKGFQLLSWLILGVSLRDTQSGMKIFKREILEVILPLILVKRYAFDLELCFLAHKHGFRIVEAPVHLEYHYGVSGINLVTPFNMLKDILAIRYRYSILKYYQKKFHETKFGIKS
ncbi:MAG TPA: glycosyltransferase family 2 protein, partial [Spirochaetia bacterium]|nr:glycosyltransferase family 2 protein [Spirochaetia bacterium]